MHRNMVYDYLFFRLESFTFIREYLLKVNQMDFNNNYMLI